MNGSSNESLSPIKLALAKIRELQDELARLTQPIAIVAMGFRLPGGAVDTESFWRILCSGKDVATAVPRQRWDHDDFYSADPNQPAKIYVKEAAFVENIDHFDAGFFGIGPREAEWMDPQQRLLLEIGWETMERACWKSDSSENQHKTGVFVGAMWSEYTSERAYRLHEISPYLGTGSGGSFLSGRISYHLGLCGPSQVLDTACSSSLVAIHLACESIRRGECTRALAGGVSLMLSPETLIQICKMRALSTDGRCKTFDASADGYGRGEGCGLVALRRLSDAVRDGDPILAVIRGSAYNHNGANSGLTAPDAQAQRAVVEQAIRNAGIQPHRISYVEAHGTGTSLGDPIELRALWSVLKQGRDNQSVPLMVSSVKTVIGHLESAAGVAGVIKVLISLQKESVPPHLHLRKLNPIIAAENLPIDIPLEKKPWPRTGDDVSRYAGISSFGMSGVNCHMIIAEHEPQQAAMQICSTKLQAADASQCNSDIPLPAEVVFLSARCSAALLDLAKRYAEAMDSDDSLRLADLAHTTAKGRIHFDHRAAIVAHSLFEARERCLKISQGLSDRYVQTGIVCNRSKLAWMIGESSDGLPQLSQAALQLSSEFPVFSAYLRRFHLHLMSCTSFALFEYLGLPKDTSTSEATSSRARFHAGQLTAHEQWIVTQFSMTVALGQLWYSWKIIPDAILCQGQLRFAAAVLAAWITPEEGVELTIRWLRDELSDQSLPSSESHASVSARDSTAHTADHSTCTPATIGLVRWESGVTMSGQPPWYAGQWANFITQPGTQIEVGQHIDELSKMQCGLLMDLTFPSHTSSQIAGHWPNAQAPCVLACLPAPDSMTVSARLKVMLAKFYTHGFLPDAEPGQASSERTKICLPTYPFQRSRYWVAASKHTEPDLVESHPLLGYPVRLAGSSDVRFEKRVTKREPEFLIDHRVFGNIVFPGAGYAEMMLKSVGERLEICNLQIETPLGVSQPIYLQTVVRSQAEQGNPVVEIFSRTENNELWTRHASCQSRPKDTSPRTQIDLQQLRASCAHIHDVKEHYRNLSESGLAYGPAFQTIRELRSSINNGQVLAQLAVQDAAVSPSWIVPPEILDGAFQSLAAFSQSPSADIFVPVGIKRIVAHGVIRESAWSFARWRPSDIANQWEADLYLFDDAENLIVEVEGLQLRRASRQAMRQVLQSSETKLLYSTQWQPLESTSFTADATACASNWFIIGSDADVRVVQQAFERRGVHVSRVSTVLELLQAVQEPSSPPCEIVWLANAASQQESSSCPSSEAFVESTRLQLNALLELVQALVSVGSQVNCRLSVLTQSAVSPHGLEPVNATHSSIWGFVRALQSEHPELRPRLLDFQNLLHDAIFGVDLLLSETTDHQVAISESTYYAPRLTRQDLHKTLPPGDYQLSIRARGSLDGMAVSPIAVEPPGPGHVQVAVGAAAINFRDVLNQLGAYPGNPGPLGVEMAGEIVALGEGVKSFSVGERVFGFCSGAFATRINTPAKLLARQPTGMNDVESSAIPTAFCTAFLSYQLAQLAAGQRVLIHAASGGLGLAAIQLAFEAGAIVYATASHPKQDYLRSLGVEHIYDSRSTAFADQILHDTDGRGVDVVLNSLTGEGFIEASLRALKTDGTWIEVAKRNTWTDSQMRERRPEVKYHVIALDEIVAFQFDQANALLTAVAQKFDQGAIKPLRHKVYSISDAAVAFRYMQHARHIGKLVLRISHDVRLRGDATYLITGGLGALGLRTARWLAEQGARRLVLCSLSEPTANASKEAELIARNCNCIVETVQADLSSRAEVERLTTWLRFHQYPLRGIIHAAGALDDGVIKEQNPHRLAKVLGAKAYGAWYLHELCNEPPLDFFVTYSSIAAVMGSAGQSNYCAANAFLDGLASYRQSQGLNGISINWGPWGDGGMANNDTVRARSEKYGISYLEPEAALDALGHALTTGLTQSVIVDADWQKFSSILKGRRPPIFERVMASDTSLKINTALHEQLQAASFANQSELLQAFLNQEIQQVLALSQKPAQDIGFFDLGMDSLMAIELGSRLRSQLGDINLPPTLALEYPTVNKLTEYLLAEIRGLWARQRSTVQTPQASLPAEMNEESATLAAAQAKVAAMTEGEIDYMLAQMTETPVVDLDEQYETRWLPTSNPRSKVIENTSDLDAPADTDD